MSTISPDPQGWLTERLQDLTLTQFTTLNQDQQLTSHFLTPSVTPPFSKEDISRQRSPHVDADMGGEKTCPPFHASTPRQFQPPFQLR